jgi:hypothetical protein
MKPLSYNPPLSSNETMIAVSANSFGLAFTIDDILDEILQQADLAAAGMPLERAVRCAANTLVQPHL